MSVQLLSQLLKFQDQVNAIAPQILAAGRACRASIDPIQLLKFQDQVNAIAPQILAAGRACRASIDPISPAPERLAINQKTSMIFGHTPRSILPTRKLQRSVVQRRSNPHQRRIGFASWKE